MRNISKQSFFLENFIDQTIWRLFSESFGLVNSDYLTNKVVSRTVLLKRTNQKLLTTVIRHKPLEINADYVTLGLFGESGALTQRLIVHRPVGGQCADGSIVCGCHLNLLMA